MKAANMVLVAFALVLLAGAAHASIAIIPSVKTVNMTRNDSIGLQFQVKNLGDRECIEMSVDADDSYIETGLSREEFCLNENEATTVTITIRTINAPRGLHNINLIAESDSGDAHADISVYVGEEPEVELVAYPNDICAGDEAHLSILVRNNSDEFKEVRLQAENEMLLPYFEPEELTLTPYEEEYVKLRIFASPYSAEGMRYVSMYAITDDEVVKERLALDIVDCEGFEEPTFSVSVPSSCQVVRKGEEERIYFRVRNKLEEPQRVYFSVSDDLDAELEADSAWLDEGEQRSFYFTVSPGTDAEIDDYDLLLHVWSSVYSVEKTVCVRTGRMHESAVEVVENNLVIEQCNSAVFTVLVSNNGDYDEEFELEIEEIDEDIAEVTMSEDFFELEAGEEKEVYINVTVMPDAELGDFELELTIEAEDETYARELRFTVVEESVPAAGELSIESYPSKVAVDENSSSSVFVSIKNNGTEEIENVAVSLFGLPDGVTATQATHLSLLPGEEKQVELTVSAEFGAAGEHEAAIRAYNQLLSAEKSITISVAPVEAETTGQFLAGLAVLGASALLGLVALMVLVAIIVFITRWLRKPQIVNETPLWLRR